MPPTHWLRGRMDPSHTCGVNLPPDSCCSCPARKRAAEGPDACFLTAGRSLFESGARVHSGYRLPHRAPTLEIEIHNLRDPDEGKSCFCRYESMVSSRWLNAETSRCCCTVVVYVSAPALSRIHTCEGHLSSRHQTAESASGHRQTHSQVV